MRLLRTVFLGLVAIMLSGCTGDDVQDAYSVLPANFVFRYCATVPQMRAALNGSPGSYFTVTATASNQYIITSNDDPSNKYVYTWDEVDKKVNFISISGFIIGTPVFSSTLQAYDLTCPNCFLSSIRRPLTFESRTLLRCSHCHCAYNLDDEQAILVEGETKAKVLHRYHVAYDGMNSLSVTN